MMMTMMMMNHEALFTFNCNSPVQERNFHIIKEHVRSSFKYAYHMDTTACHTYLSPSAYPLSESESVQTQQHSATTTKTADSFTANQWLLVRRLNTFNHYKAVGVFVIF